MQPYLCISATFLTLRYHGDEWPPSPARLFQALLAGANTGAYKQHWATVEQALTFIENLAAPELIACRASQLPPYRISVPNNDSEKIAGAWKAGEPDRAATLAAKLRTAKTFAPWRLADRHDGAAHVYYLWNVLNETPPLDSLRRLTSFLHTIGWGIDMAFADSFLLNEEERQKLATEIEYLHLIPGERGELRKIAAPGYLQDLSTAYKRYLNRSSNKGINPSNRATKYGCTRYLRKGFTEPPYAKFVLRKLDSPALLMPCRGL